MFGNSLRGDCPFSRFVCAGRWSLRLILLAMLKYCVAPHAQAPLTGMRASNKWRSYQTSSVRPKGSSDPWFTRISIALAVEANDNINVSQSDPEEDLILRPSTQIQVGYSLTEISSLSLDVSAGYAKYIAHPENDTFVLNTEGLTGLDLDLHVSRTRINLHSEFSLQQDPVSEGEVSGQADYRKFINISGFVIEPEYDRLHITIGYDHITELYSGALADQNRSVESVFGEVGRRVGDSALYSLAFGGAYVGPTSGGHNDGFTYSVSIQAATQISEYLRFRAEAGYGGVQFNGSSVAFDAEDGDTFFGSLAIENRLNQWVSQTLRGGTDILPSVRSNFRKVIYLTHMANWTVVRHVSLSSELFYENSASSLNLGGERYDRYGVGAGISIHLAGKLDGRIGYRFALKESNLSGNDYSQNQVTLTITRQF